MNWLDRPESHDFTAAYDYLSLLLDPVDANHACDKLFAVGIRERKAKDILRASGLPLLGPDNGHVKKDLQKIKDGKEISPILLVRMNNRLEIADGYHRVCAIYHHDEDTPIRCALVSLQ